MALESIFIQPETRRLRSVWRVACFYAVLSAPRFLWNLLAGAAPNAAVTANHAFVVDWVMIVVYVVMVAWVAVVSMAGWHWLDGASWRAWGYQFHRGWFRDAALGVLAGSLMIAGVVSLQVVSGGTRLQFNQQSAGQLLSTTLLTAVMLWLAAAFEELTFRGYIFQTLLGDFPAWLPVVMLAVFFGMAHWSNPSRTSFSTLNTSLAGVWLALSVLRTRSLWLATGLHFSWNWAMGAVFGLPVSGLLLPNPLFLATSTEPHWITGGSYGSEGGIAATLAFALGTLWVWRTSRFDTAPETKSALAGKHLPPPATFSLQFNTPENKP